MIKFEQREREMMRLRGVANADTIPIKRPTCCQLLCFKLKLIKQCFSEPVFYKFIIFLLLQGITMP